MKDYLLVVYDTKTKEFYNKVVKDYSKSSALSIFMVVKRPEEVIINIMDYDG